MWVWELQLPQKIGRCSPAVAYGVFVGGGGSFQASDARGAILSFSLCVEISFLDLKKPAFWPK